MVSILSHSDSGAISGAPAGWPDLRSATESAGNRAPPPTPALRLGQGLPAPGGRRQMSCCKWMMTPPHPPYADSHLFPLSESCATVNPCDWPERSALSQSCALFLILMPCDCEISALIYIPCALVLEKLYPALKSCYAFYAGRKIIAFFSWQKCIHKYKDKTQAQTRNHRPFIISRSCWKVHRQ